MTLLYFSWNSLWFGWKFHFHLERNCHLCFFRFLPDHSYSLAISLARFPSNFLPHSLPSSWNGYGYGYDWFPRLFCAWASWKRYLTPGPLCAKTKMVADSSFTLPSVADKFRYGPSPRGCQVLEQKWCFNLQLLAKVLPPCSLRVFWLKWTSDR